MINLDQYLQIINKKHQRTYNIFLKKLKILLIYKFKKIKLFLKCLGW